VNRRSEVIYQKGDTVKRALPVQYIGGLFKGTMSIIDEPGEKELGVYSELVYQNVPYTKAGSCCKRRTWESVPMKVGDPSPVKYVFYIIKENRTYDQVLGM